MERVAVCVALCLIINLVSATGSPGCYWDLNLDIPKMDPLYYTNTNPSSLIIPGPTGIGLQDSEYMTLICIGKSNTIFGTGQQELTLQCVSNNKLLYNGTQYDLNQFYCAANTLSDVVLTGTPCASGRGEIMNLGFNSTKGFATQVQVCYDRFNETALYAVNTIFGKSIAHAETENDRPSFRNQGLSYGTTTANQYKQTSQTTRLNLLLGPLQTAKYINTTSYLSRGHLAPDGDFLFGSWSTATYFLVNAAPQWQVVNTGNWLRVENSARQVADLRQEDLTIVTGTNGILKLPNDLGLLVEIFLFDVRKLPVPKWYWKIVYSIATHQAIAFVTLNNPHATSISPSELLCPNICATTGWARPEYGEFAKGYTYCCDVNALIATVGTLNPLAITVTGLLTGPY